MPRSTREIADVCRLRVCEEWADEQGVEIEWGGDSEPVGARLLAICDARERGIYPGPPHELHPLLRRMERHGLIARVQLEGHRPMLWRRVEVPPLSGGMR